ncbi:LysR family transcriptional regulator [Jannaschia sp. M317]|nr:LysR family transcriptional regulator [Jannaschia sp. M317]
MKSRFRNWSDIRIFLAVMETGSTLAASRRLGMAQPTVARRIDALEHALGLTLFDRDTRGARPTDEARALLPEARTIAQACCTLEESAARLTSAKAGTIRLTAIIDAFNSRLSTILEAFVADHPNVAFDLMPSDAQIDISGGACDVAIRIAMGIDDPDLICRKLVTFPLSLFASRTYADRLSQPWSEADFHIHRFFVFSGALADHPANRWLQDRIRPDQIAMTCPNMQAVKAAVLMGGGIGILPARTSTPGLVPVLPLPETVASSSWLVVNPTAWRRPEVKAFAAFFAPRYTASFAADRHNTPLEPNQSNA